MSVTIQDDMWRSAEAMKGKQGDEFLLALLRYGFDGTEPSERSGVYPAFVLCKDRIGMSATASTKGRRMAEARWSKQDAQASAKHDADAPDKQHAQASSEQDAQERDQHQVQDDTEQDAEVRRGEVRRGEESRDNASIDASPERNAQVAEVIAHLNEVCGTSYRPNAEMSRKYVGARLDDGFTVEDCKRVIDNMARAWMGDAKMCDFLRPTTLFRKEKFEGYLNRVSEVSSRYAEYD